MTTLFDRTQLGELILPNRLVMAPMTRARASAGGLANGAMATYYAQRATAGLIVSEGVQPSLQGQSNPGTPGLHTDEQVTAWREVTGAVHANGGRIFAQLMHAGRVGHPEVAGLTPVAPSAVRLDAQLYTGPKGLLPAPVPRALSTAEVRDEVEVFANAARRAVQAGFNGIELHGAHGYFIQQFLSSNVNQRTDAYGGSVAGRIRFAVEVAEATAAAIGPERVGLRLSPGAGIWGVQEEDVLALYTALLRELAPLGLAYVHLGLTTDEDNLMSLRRTWPGTLIINPAHPQDTQPASLAVGEAWLRRGADLISYGRAFIANPDLVERLRQGLPLAEAEQDAYYQGDRRGYLTYSSYQH
ncbi:alkene reductase [Deinococcus sp. HMF7620]|uniref:Alkene reductase n=1 Tax=Deinococcus arboris TaxID=2682977 RepID=A0A7C9HTM4_9DEIO|nr:alkene reductase [Deinococcus arboris]MVN88674.1 alkene reductase [Deinococcus arboris]